MVGVQLRLVYNCVAEAGHLLEDLMESVTIKRPSNLGFYRRIGNISVPVLGVMLLVIFSALYARSTSDFKLIFFLACSSEIIMIGVSYLLFRRVVRKLEDRVDDLLLSKLCRCANSMASCGYAACVMTFIFASHH